MVVYNRISDLETGNMFTGREMGTSPFRVNQVNDTNVQQHATAYLNDSSILTYDTTLITFTNMYSVKSQKSRLFTNT